MTLASALRLPDLGLPGPLLDRLAALAVIDGPPAVMYARISQDRVGAHLGADRQIGDMCDLAVRQKVRVIGVYVDNDISAYTGKRRPDYIEMTARLVEGAAAAVLAWHTDRLYRPRGTELEDYITLCESRDIPTYTVQAGVLDLTTANGRLNARISGAVARHESEQKGERLRAQRRQVQESGGHHGGRRRFGFAADNVAHDELEARLIREAANELLAGGSLYGVARRWNELEVTTSTGGQWSTRSLRAMLLRPCNAGLVGNTKGKIVGPAQWKAIIAAERWEALTALLTDPARRWHDSGRPTRTVLGSHLYFCDCGRPLMSGGTSGSGKARYRCADAHLSRQAEPIDALVCVVVERLLATKGKGLVPPTEDLSPLRDRLAVLVQRQREVAELLADPESGMTPGQFRAANGPLVAEIASLRSTLAARSVKSVLGGVADADDPVAAWRAVDEDRKRAIIRALVKVTVLRSTPELRFTRTFDVRSVRIEPAYGPAAGLKGGPAAGRGSAADVADAGVGVVVVE